jgi:superfamily I DNA/RNA helicase
MSDIINVDNQKYERDYYVDLIMKSNWPKKIIVSGPGTGKTYLFKKILAGKSNGIALTFINNLTQQLAKDLSGIADAYTFHAYCKKLLHKTAIDGIDFNFEFFPKLDDIINSDSKIFLSTQNNFRAAFQNLIEDDGRIDFYLSRANFYNAVSYDDSVYRMLKYYSSHPDQIPSFDQIVVDEYQDFNQLEVSFIDKLSVKSPILIVGDDDQAIYDFKFASPEFIREKYKDPNFKSFELPFSSRCTQVIVDTVENIVSHAKLSGKLNGRIDKKFFCYVPDKQEENSLYPNIEHVKCSVHSSKKVPYISCYIEKEIEKIPQEIINKIIQNTKVTGEPGVLIIGPSHYLDSIYEYLKTRYNNLIYKKPDNDALTVIDGYEILLKNEKSNLGWRILLEFMNTPGKNGIILSCNNNDLIDKIDPEIVKSKLSILPVLRKVKANTVIAENEKIQLEESLKTSYDSLVKVFNTDEDDHKEVLSDEIKIQLTTFNGCKGLSAAYVFIVGLNNGDFPRNPQNPTDNEICQFIVALTRTRKKCYLISNSRFGGNKTGGPSLFIDWVDKTNIHFQDIDKDYFK